MEWDTPPRAGQRPRKVQIPSVSGRLTIYQMAMAFDTPPKPPNPVPTGASFLVGRPVGRSVFMSSLTKLPAPTRCEQKTLPTAENTARAHVPLNSRDALAAPQGASSLRNPWDAPPSKQEQRRALKQTCPPRKSTLTPFRCLRNNSWFPRLSTLLHPHLFQSTYLPMTVRRILLSTLVQ